MEGLTPAGAPGPDGEPAVRSPYLEPGLYDLLFEGYREDLAFYLGHAASANGPVLELACGTGRVLLPLLEAGVDAEGLDAEPGMLAELHRKATARRLEAHATFGDMRDFDLPRRFALIISPFNALVHNLTPEDWLATLRVCRAHLEPGGALLFDVQTMNLADLEDPDGVPVQEFEVKYPDVGLSLRLWDTRWKDPVTQLQRSHIEIQELDGDGRVTVSHRFEATVRWVQKNEMALLLALAGFERWTITGGFDGEPLDDDSLQMVVQAWKAGA